MKFLSRHVVNVLLSLASIFCFLLVAAGAFEIFAADYKKPNLAAWLTRHVVLNGAGYRDREFSPVKPKDVFRILILGDSQTFGQGIDRLEDVFPKRLESLLNEGLGKNRFEVMNAAKPGWNTDDELYELFKTGFLFQPDLIVLGFFLNDVPAPPFFDCDAEDRDFFPALSKYEFARQSALYGLLQFRLNRLLETANKKPTHTDCLNHLYSSRGWSMEKVYLDTIRMASQAKNVHFMMAIIPAIYKLGDDYPFKKQHALLNGYCRENGVECVDLYADGFKNLDAETLILSKNDRHMNAEGARVAAETLFKRLRILKTFKNLPAISPALPLGELLDIKGNPIETDKAFPRINDGSSPISPSRATSDAREPGKQRKRDFLFEQRIVDFIPPSATSAYQAEDYAKLMSLEIEKNIYFGDPKVLEQMIFAPDGYDPFRKNERGKMADFIKTTLEMYPEAFVDLAGKDLSEKLSWEEFLSIYKETLFFNAFMFYEHFPHKSYFAELLEEISRHEKSAAATAKNALKRLRLARRGENQQAGNHPG